MTKPEHKNYAANLINYMEGLFVSFLKVEVIR